MFKGIFYSKDRELNLEEMYKIIEVDFNHISYGEITSDLYDHIADIPFSVAQNNFILDSDTSYLMHFKIPNDESTLEIVFNVKVGQLGTNYISKITYIYGIPKVEGKLGIATGDIVEIKHQNELFEAKLRANKRLSKLINNYFINNTDLEGVPLILNSFLESFDDNGNTILLSNLPIQTERGIYLHGDISIDILNEIYQEALKF